ncbi:MAG: hypothetical protein JWN98_186 [Abditibacteriota bacterium]|nr:hypothetical protein [Abditibacteriota bacterium]
MLLDQLLAAYTPFDETEAIMMRQLQQFLVASPNPTQEDMKTLTTAFGRELHGQAPHYGHITGSAWLINGDASRAVLVHHAKLNRWLQPGGHCDGEADVLRVALREAQEETGLVVTAVHSAIFDIDVHVIPEYWNTPAHRHYDVRFLLQANDASTPQVSVESRAVRWVKIEEIAALNSGASIARMVAKTRRLQQAAQSATAALLPTTAFAPTTELTFTPDR